MTRVGNKDARRKSSASGRCRLFDGCALRTVRKSGTLKRVSCMALSLALAATMMLPLAGCKDTDVLTELIIDQNAETDYSLEPTALETPEAEQNDVNHQDLDNNFDEPEEASADDPTYDATSESNEDATQNNYGNATPNDEKATNGGSQGEQANGGGDAGSGSAGSGTVGSGTESNSSGSGEESSDTNSNRVEVTPVDGTTPGDEASDNPSDEQQQAPGGYTGTGTGQGSGGTGQLYGGDGTYTKLPTDARKIAASGQLATIVQMIGGAGALAAADTEWITTMNANEAFPGELGGVQQAWSGNGSAEGSASVDAIIASGADAVLTSTTYGGITQVQADALYAAGIDVVYMPAVGVSDAYDADIVQAVRVVGELLKNAGTAIQYNAQAMASEYVRQHDAALAATVQANNGYTTWMGQGENRTWLYQGQNLFGGITATWFSANRYIAAYVDNWADPLVDRYHDAGFDVNTATGIGMYAKKSGANTSIHLVMDYYLQHAGAMDTLMRHQVYGWWSEEDPAMNPEVFDFPYFGYSVTGLGKQTLYHFSYATDTEASALTNGYFDIGDANYPAIIARSSEYADKIKAGALVYASPYNPINEYTGETLFDSYEVWVMPSGITGSWVDGTVESFLVAPWAYCMYQQGKDLSSCNSYVNNFYETFFRCGGSAVQDYGNVISVSCATA